MSAIARSRCPEQSSNPPMREPRRPEQPPAPSHVSPDASGAALPEGALMPRSRWRASAAAQSRRAAWEHLPSAPDRAHRHAAAHPSRDRTPGRLGEPHGAGRGVAPHHQRPRIIAEDRARHAAKVAEGRSQPLAPLVLSLTAIRSPASNRCTTTALDHQRPDRAHSGANLAGVDGHGWVWKVRWCRWADSKLDTKMLKMLNFDELQKSSYCQSYCLRRHV